MEGFKGDLQLKNFLIEAKSTTGLSIGVKFDWLVKIAKEARQTGKTPVLAISFVKGSGDPEPNGEWAMIPMSLFKEIVGD